MNRLHARSFADEEAIGDEAERSDVDEAPALVDEVGERAVYVRIFADGLTGLLNIVDEKLRATAFQSHPQRVRRFDVDRPLFFVVPSKIKARCQRAVGGSAAELDRCGDWRLSIFR